MNLVIIHYHLNRGGVTSVIRNHLLSLLDDRIEKVLILHGPGTQGWSESDFADEPKVKRYCLESLGYRTDDVVHPSTANVDDVDSEPYDSVCQILAANDCDPTNTLIHIHNHNLGKNNFLLPAIARWSDDGYSLLLQIHDFAEDMRPDNFQGIAEYCQARSSTIEALLYPARPNIHYAFLNRRDLELGRRFLADESQTHWLPNPVFLDPHETDESRRMTVRSRLGVPEESRLVIYPVRAIRRKNVAEALLFAAVHPDVLVGVTLPAQSEKELPHYQALKNLAERLELPVLFELGMSDIAFTDLMNAADCFFTSSVAEGFGMAFLESWMWNKPLIGRNLDGITRDFSEAGLELTSMYEQVCIPLSWIELEHELSSQQVIFEGAASQFSLGIERQVTWDSELENGWVDFGKLTFQTQQRVVELVAMDEAKRSDLLALNVQFSIPEFNSQLIERNQAVVQTEFMKDAFRRRFHTILGHYQRQSDSRAEVSPIQKGGGCQHLVETFLDPENFFPIRVQIQ